MLYTKANFAVVHGANDDEYRPDLNGVHLRPDGATEASNGRVLFKVSKAQADPDEFPQLPDGCASAPPNGEIVPVDTIKKVLKAIPIKANLPILRHVELIDKGRFFTTDLDNKTIIDFRPVDGSYPDTDGVYPKPDERPCIRIGFSVDVLESMCKFVHAAKGGDKEREIIALTFYGPSSGAVFSAGQNDDGQEISGMIMPCKLKD